MIYRQGHLDGLCGIYSVINIITHFFDVTDDEVYKIFTDLIVEFEEEDPLIQGISHPPIERGFQIIRKNKRFKSLWYKQFKRKSEHDLNPQAFIDRMKREIDKGNVIYCGISKPQGGHWTIIDKIDDKINFRDSSHLKPIKVDRINYDESKVRTIYFHQEEMYIVGNEKHLKRD